MTTSKIKGLIFDIGGTLFFSDKTNLTNAGKKLLIYLKKHGIIINEKADAFGQYIKAQNKKYKEYCNKMNDIEISPYELVTKFWLEKYLQKNHLTKIKVIANKIINCWKFATQKPIRKNALVVLKTLKKQGYKLGIISNTISYDFVLLRLFDNKLYQFFDPNCIYLSVQSQIRKPNSSIFDAACCDLGLKNNEVVYVGDTISRDVIGSKNARLKACIRIKSNFKDEASFKDTPYIINDLKEIFELIKKINKI